MIIDVAEQFYFRPEGVHVLASPCDETPMEPHDVRHEELDVALGIERVGAVTTMTIRSVVRAWAGLRSFVADHRPVNGWDPAVPGFYWLAGQGGFGIKTSPAMARFAAGMIRDGKPPQDLIDAGITTEAVGVERLSLQP
jgi:D-arginine dehydrogenase